MYFARIKKKKKLCLICFNAWVGKQRVLGEREVRQWWEHARLAGVHRFFSPCSSVYFHVFRGIFYFKEYHCVENHASVPSGCTKTTETMMGASTHMSQTCQSLTQWQDFLGCTSSSRHWEKMSYYLGHIIAVPKESSGNPATPAFQN